MNARTKKDESPGVTIKKFSSRSGIVSLCTPTNDEIALTLALSHRNGRGNFLDLRDLFSYPRPLAGEGRVRVRCQASTVFKRRTRRARRLELSLSRIFRVLRDLRGDQLASLSFMSLLFFASSSFAQAPFYAGKTITIIRGSAPGGVGEMRTRAVANYLKKHVPGNPTILIEFMPGAGGIKAANHLYRGARTDGLVIGSAPSGMVSSLFSANQACSTISINLFTSARRTASRIMCFLPIENSVWVAWKNCAHTRDCGSAPRPLAIRSTLPVACSL